MAESKSRIQLERVYNADDSGASGGDESTGGTHVAWDRVKGRGGGGGAESVPEAAIEGEDAAARAERKRDGEGTPTKTTVCESQTGRCPQRSQL